MAISAEYNKDGHVVLSGDVSGIVHEGYRAWEVYDIDGMISRGEVKPYTEPAESEPTQPTGAAAIAQNERQAKQARDNAISSDIECKGALWQCLSDAKDIRKVINDAETISSAETDTAMFRLADNTWRETSLAELREVLIAFVIRKRDIWQQFGVWDASDKLTAFEVK